MPVGVERIPLEHGWPGWWSKFELFRPDINGDLLFFDLDTIITGSLKEIGSINGLTLLSDFYHPENVASGMMFLPWFHRGAIWREWMKGPEAHMRRLGGRGDQGLLQEFWNGRAYRWQDMLPGQVVSYKAHVRKSENIHESGTGAAPEGARVVCFHGKPKPRDVQWKV